MFLSFLLKHNLLPTPTLTKFKKKKAFPVKRQRHILGVTPSHRRGSSSPLLHDCNPLLVLRCGHLTAGGACCKPVWHFRVPVPSSARARVCQWGVWVWFIFLSGHSDRVWRGGCVPSDWKCARSRHDHLQPKGTLCTCCRCFWPSHWLTPV